MVSGEAFVTYQLIFELTQAATVTVGRLGTFTFAAGTYCYTGSARRNFEARVRRHLAHDKKLRWHIDYLLAATGVRVLEIRRSCEPECALNQSVRGTIPVAGFGASDCRAGCSSHLKLIACSDVADLVGPGQCFHLAGEENHRIHTQSL
jgi:Uri superfamily endonuclease